MRRILITGATGMVGSHLYEFLVAEGHEVLGTYFRPTVNKEEIAGHENLVEVDVRYRPQLEQVVAEFLPTEIYHLAAQSLPVRSWSNPEETFDSNVDGTINLFESIKSVRSGKSDYDPAVVVACSSAEYGASLTEENVPITEGAPLLPLHPYGVSKVAQDLLAHQYWHSDGIRGLRARIFNTTGPRKRDDVVSDFARRCARLASENKSELKTGNLETRRAILDVRDLIAALIAIAQKGEAGEAYNICSDELVKIDQIVKLMEEAAGQAFAPVKDPSLFRPTDEAVIFGSHDKLTKQTGWTPRISIKETVKAVYDYEKAALTA